MKGCIKQHNTFTFIMEEITKRERESRYSNNYIYYVVLTDLMSSLEHDVTIGTWLINRFVFATQPT